MIRFGHRLFKAAVLPLAATPLIDQPVTPLPLHCMQAPLAPADAAPIAKRPDIFALLGRAKALSKPASSPATPERKKRQLDDDDPSAGQPPLKKAAPMKQVLNKNAEAIAELASVDPSDWYIPEVNKSRKEPAAAWSFFKRRKSDDEKGFSRAWCQLQNCGAPIVPLSGSTTSNLTTHLKSKWHGLSKQQIETEDRRLKSLAQQGEEAKLATFDFGDEDQVAAIAAANSKAERTEIAQKKAGENATKAVGAPEAKILSPNLPQSVKRKLDEAFARAFCGQRLRPTTIGEGPEVHEFFTLLLQQCGATHSWFPPDHAKVSEVLSADLLEYPVVIITCVHYLGPPVPFSFPDSRDLLEVLRDFLGRERGGSLGDPPGP